jgi:hypothetical protein
VNQQRVDTARTSLALLICLRRQTNRPPESFIKTHLGRFARLGEDLDQKKLCDAARRPVLDSC